MGGLKWAVGFESSNGKSWALPAEGFVKGFFPFPRGLRQGVKRRKVAPTRHNCKYDERFSGKPAVPGQIPGEENRRRNTTHQYLRAKRNQHSHAGLPLATHLPEFHLAWEGDRGPVGDAKLTHDRKNDRGARSCEHRG